MKVLLLSAISTLLLFSFSSLETAKQSGVPTFKVVYHPLSCAKIDPETDTIVETWKTENTGTYRSNSKKLLFSYTETNQNRKVVKSYSHPIVGYHEDSLVYALAVRNPDDDGIYHVIFWKDKHMIVIEAGDWNYLISN